MVLEYLFPENWLERKHRYAFILAVAYSTVGIVLARLLFAANSGIVSIAFTSLLLMPSLKKLLRREESKELKERRFTLRHFWLDNKQALLVYGTIFLGIYLTFTLYTFLLPLFGFEVGNVFREQLAFEANLRGGAFGISTFLGIFMNNWWVLLACFLVALIAGDGALFFVAWNASTWGAIFGFRAVEAGFNGGAFHPFVNLIIIFFLTLPHVALEGGAYILAAIAGGVLSDDVVSKRRAMNPFIYWFLSGIIFFIILHYLFGMILVHYLVIARILDIIAIILIFHFFSSVFDDKRHKEVFRYNYWLFLLAIVIFILGAVVETLVVGNSALLHQVYLAAFGF